MQFDLTAAQVVELVKRGGLLPDFQPRTLQYWTNEGVVEPTDATAIRHRRYSFDEAKIARACAALSHQGVNVRQLKCAASELRAILGQQQFAAPASKKFKNAWGALDRASRGEQEAFYIFYLDVEGNAKWAVSETVSAPAERPFAFVALDWKRLMEKKP